MRHILLALLLSLVGGVALAQGVDEAWLEGTLVSKTDKSPLVNALVALRTAEGKDTSFRTITDEKGYFLLKAIPGKYHLGASFAQQPIVLRPSLELRSGRLQLGILPVELTRELSSVVVQRRAPLVRYEGTTLIFGEAAFAHARGGSVLDGLKLIPGLQLEGANTLKLYGLSEVTVYIDGRQQRMTKDEVIALLQSMSVSELSSVELIREPGVEYGGVTSPILNIKRKTVSEEGIKGFTGAIGTYQYLVSEQLSTRVNLSSGNSRSYISYAFGDRRKRETTTFSTGYTDDLRTDSRLSHQVGLGTDLTLGKRNTLGAQILWNYADENLKFTERVSNTLKWKNAYGTIYHTYRAERWVLQTTGEASQGSSDIRRDNPVVGVSNKDDNHFLRLALAYAMQLSKVFTLYAGAEASHVAIDSKRTLATDKSTLREWDIEGYASLRFRTPRFFGNAGLRVAGEDRTGDLGTGIGSFSHSGMELLPYASLAYQPAQGHQVSLTHTSSYTRPSYRDLLGYTSTASGLLTRGGNTQLATSYRRSLTLNYSYLRAAQLELSYVDTKDPVVEAITADHGTYALQRINLDYSRYLRALLILPIPIIHHGELSWTASTYLAAQRQWDAGRVASVDYSKTFNAYYAQHKHSLGTPSGWTAELGVTYYSSLMYGLYAMQRQWWVDASLSKRFGDLRVSLSAHDLFNTNIARGAYELSSPAFTFERNWHSPRLQLTLSYSWGKKSLKTNEERTRHDDTKRLSTEANEGLNLSTEPAQ